MLSIICFCTSITYLSAIKNKKKKQIKATCEFKGNKKWNNLFLIRFPLILFESIWFDLIWFSFLLNFFSAAIHLKTHSTVIELEWKRIELNFKCLWIDFYFNFSLLYAMWWFSGIQYSILKLFYFRCHLKSSSCCCNAFPSNLATHVECVNFYNEWHRSSLTPIPND